MHVRMLRQLQPLLALLVLAGVACVTADYVTGFGEKMVQEDFDPYQTQVHESSVSNVAHVTSVNIGLFCSGGNSETNEEHATGSQGLGFQMDYGTYRLMQNRGGWRATPDNVRRYWMRMGGRMYWRWAMATPGNGCPNPQIPGADKVELVYYGVLGDNQPWRKYEANAYPRWTWMSEKFPKAFIFRSSGGDQDAHQSRYKLRQQGVASSGDEIIGVDDVAWSCDNNVHQVDGDLAGGAPLLLEDFADATLDTAWADSAPENLTLTTSTCGQASAAGLDFGDANLSYLCLDVQNNGKRELMTDALDARYGLLLEYWYREMDAVQGFDLQVLWRRVGEGFGWRPLRSYVGRRPASSVWDANWFYDRVAIEPQSGLYTNIEIKFRITPGPDGETFADAQNAWALDQVSIKRFAPLPGAPDNYAIEFGRYNAHPHIAPAINDIGFGRISGDRHVVGVMDYITTDLTVEVMVKPFDHPNAPDDGSSAIIAMINEDNAREVDWELRLTGNSDSTPGFKPQFEVVSNAGSRWAIRSKTDLAPDTWYTLTGVLRNATSLELYVDGVQLTDLEVDEFGGWSAAAGDTHIQMNDHQNDRGFYLGWRPDHDADFDIFREEHWLRFHGAMDEVRVWNRSLSAGEIMEWAGSTMPDAELYVQLGLVLYLPFDNPDCYDIINNRPDSRNPERWGDISYVVSDSGATQAVRTKPDQVPIFALGGTHEAVPSSQMTFLVMSLPTRGFLYQVDEANGYDEDAPLELTDLPAVVTNSGGRLAYNPNNTCVDAECMLEQHTFLFTVQTAVPEIGHAQRNATFKIVVDNEYVPPPPKGQTFVQEPARVVVLTQLELAILVVSGFAALLMAGAGAYLAREQYQQRLSDKYRAFWAHPKFTLESAYVKTYKPSGSDLAWYRKNRKHLATLNDVLMTWPYKLLHSLFRSMKTADSDDFVRSVVFIAESRDEALPVIRSFIDIEISTARMLTEKKNAKEIAENDLFRGFSISAKMWTGYVRMGFGLKYLKEALSAPLYEVCTRSASTMEIDQDRKEEAQEDTAVNKYELLAAGQKVLTAIAESVDKCPPHIRMICNYVYNQVGNALGEHKYKAVGGFMFLRFFCPAIAVPEQYDMLDEQSADDARRLLTLISKMLSNLASQVMFGEKEEYMAMMNEFIENNIPVMQRFIDQVSTIPDDEGENDGHLETKLPAKVTEVANVIVYSYLHKNFPDMREKLSADRTMTGDLRNVAKSLKAIGKPRTLKSADDTSSDDDRSKKQSKKKKKRSKSHR